MGRGIHGHPLPKEKKIYYIIFLFLFIFRMYIRNDVSRWTSLSKKFGSTIAHLVLLGNIYGAIMTSDCDVSSV